MGAMIEQLEAANSAAKIFEGAGFETSAVAVDISQRESILKLALHAQQFAISQENSLSFHNSRYQSFSISRLLLPERTTN